MGSGFTGATAVEFGPNPATNFTVDSDTMITATSPGGEGAVDVTVTTPSGISPISPADHFTYAPTITSISPTSGPPTGGTVVEIVGASFLFSPATAVDFGSTPAASFTIVSDNEILAVSPPGTDAVFITVTGPSGTSISTASLFTYAPAVTSVVPSSGTANGGSLVTITGTGFTGATAVDFGTMPAAIVLSITPTEIEAVAPVSGVFGAVDVTVTTAAGGTSAISPADQFFYYSAGGVAPRVTSISPSFGAPTGGNVVTITGSGFGVNTSNPLQVFFGATAATAVTVVSSTTVTAVSPPGTGTVDVTVFTSGGSSAPSTADQFTYVVNGPQVALVQRFGYHSQPTYLVVTFNGPLDPSPGQHASNYVLVGSNGKRIKVKSAIYDASTDAVTLSLSQRLSLPKTYRLTINGTSPSGLKNPDGVFLDGAGTGEPGSNYVTSITRSNLAGTASQRPAAAAVKGRAHALVARIKSAIHRHTR